MNRKERRRQARLGAAGAAKTAPPAPRGGFGASDAFALLSGARPTVPIPGALSAPTPAPRPTPEQPLFERVYFRALAALRARKSAESVVEAAEAARAEAAQLWAARRPEVEARRAPSFACATGCTWCCHQMVAAEPVEVVAIAQHVKTQFTPAARSALMERLAATDARTRGLGIVARARLKLACPFLVDSKCSIYDARPLRCRGVYSRDAGHCRWAMDNPDIYFGARDRQGPGPSPLEPVKIMNAAVVGLLQAARDAGLKPDTLELVAGVRVALEQDGAIESYLKGEPSFAAARLPEEDAPDPAPEQAAGRAASAARLAKPDDSP